MSSYRYPDSARNARDRSPPYRDRRPSNFGGGYPPRASDSVRPNADSSGFPPRDPPRGPKSLADAPRGPAPAQPLGAPAVPRDGRGRGFPGRGEPTPLRDAPPLSSGPAPPMTNTHNSWRADRDRDRDREFERDRRERRPTPPSRRSPVRDLRDPRDQRDFAPRDLDISRARRDSRDGPPSAGSTYSDPSILNAGSSYRGSGIGRGRGGRDFTSRGRNFHSDDRDRHHDPRDRMPDRSYRPRSRSPIRRERDPRDEREFDRRERFVPREYDSYIGPAGAAKPGLRTIDTHRGPGQSDSRHVPGTPTGATPHSSHHASPADRLGPQGDSYSRRPSVAVDSSASKDPRRDAGKDDLLLASRAEASRERYAPRPSSPPAAVPAFGSNVWRNPTLDAKPAAVPTPSTPSAPLAPPAPPAPPKPAPQAAPSPSAGPPPAGPSPVGPSSTAPVSAPSVPKPSVPSGLAVAPPTGPKADRVSDRAISDRPSVDPPVPENRQGPPGPPRMEPPSSTPAANSSASHPPESEKTAPKPPTPQSAAPAPARVVPPPPPPPPPPPSAPSALAKSPPQGPAPRPRPPPTAPQAALRSNISPSFTRTPLPPYVPNDAPSNQPPSQGPRNSGGPPTSNTSPKSLPANIPTGPKADRAPMASRPPQMYQPSDRPGFAAPRAPMGGGPKSMQWVRPGLIPNRATVPTKREFPSEDRDRAFGTAPKAPRLEHSSSSGHQQQQQQQQQQPYQQQQRGYTHHESPSHARTPTEAERPKGRAASAERSTPLSLKPTSVEARRHSDVVMAEASPRQMQPPMSAASSAPEALQDSDDDLDLDEEDFAESEAKYNREIALLEAKRVDLSAPHLRATSPLQDIILLSCVTVDHLPARYEEPPPVSVREEEASLSQGATSLSPTQPPTEVATVELLTPRAEDSEDVSIEKKTDREIAPATKALRLRRGTSIDTEGLPDISTLPYLGSGPPTPLSDIEQDRPSLPDSVIAAIRSRLQQATEPEMNMGETLQEYAARYKQWRLLIRQWDEERDRDDQERQPSVEPSLKATTPDVQSSNMTALLDVPQGSTGRRSHSSRWATELDLEAVIKESLKTAEEERMGKQDGEPKRSMADPEKEATLPLELSESEAQRRKFVDTNFQCEPGQGIFAFHYEPPEDDFTRDEHRVMVANYRDQYAKKWGKLAEMLYKECGTERTYKDCINHYYATKWGREYKGKAKRRGGGKKRVTGRNRGAIANMERTEAQGEDGLPLALTESGRPRRSAAPTFGGMEIDFDPTAAIPAAGKARRQADTESGQEKKRTKTTKEKGSRKTKNMPLAAAPVGSPVKVDRKDKGPGVKLEDDFSKRPTVEMPMPIYTGHVEDQMMIPGDPQTIAGMHAGMIERPKPQPNARPGPSSYWSVSELQDFEKNVAHFGTDWLAFANHMGTKTHIMIKNQYLRLVESGKTELEQMAKEADMRRERGDDLGPPPTPTPAPKRRYESTQTALPRNLAPTPEQHQSPLLSSMSLPKNSPPHSSASSRYSPIAQAPVHGKPHAGSTSGFPPLAETGHAPVTLPHRQSPPAPVPRSQPQQHHHQHSMSQSRPQHSGPRAGYFSDDVPSRLENRPSPQSNQPPRSLQQHVPSQFRPQEQPQAQAYRGINQQDRDHLARSELQQEQEAQHRYQQQHARRISQEMHHHRQFHPGVPSPMMHPVRSNSIARSPEHRAMPYSHSRQVSQAQAMDRPPAELMSQPHGTFPGSQQIPSRGSISTPPVKEEPRHASSMMPQAQAPPMLQSQHHPRSHFAPLPTQSTPPLSAAKPAAEPRKSNLLSLLNDTEPEEPRRKKPAEQGPPSHSTTPSQQTPIAPPPNAPPMHSRRDMYGETATSQPPYSRPPFAQHGSNRSVDLTNEQQAGGKGPRENWQQRQQQYHPSQAQPPPTSAPPSHPGLPQPPFSDPRLGHRSVFAQHNAPRHNPSPPPHAAYNNSPHMHSRTPSVSGSSQMPRHSITSTGPPQHAQTTPGAGSQILQPNPYAQVEPPGGAVPPTGPMGMRPSPHLRTSHMVQSRDGPSRNEHAQAQNANMAYSNPPTPNEQPAHPAMRGPGSMEPYRPRDPRDLHHDLESRNSDRDTSRELSQRTEYLREQLASRPMHEDMRYQPQQQDRGYLSQRSHTPLSRSDHGQQPPPLQHPPNSSLGGNNLSLFGQRSSEEPSHRFSQPFPRDRGIADRIREEQAQQQQAAIHREESMRREGQMREREHQERNAQIRESMRRGYPPPGSGPGSDPRPPPAGHMDWTSGVRHPQDRWQR